jgi:hypothetical protein
MARLGNMLQRSKPPKLGSSGRGDGCGSAAAELASGKISLWSGRSTTGPLLAFECARLK